MSDTAELRSPLNNEEWLAYHDVRRRVLFESRGIFNVYDPNHPDEFKSGNYPMILIRKGRVCGVIRVDIAGTVAVYRRVAVPEDLQRCGYGRLMLAEADAFAQQKGCNTIRSMVNPEAVGFYEKCGFARESRVETIERAVPMTKVLQH